MKRVVINECYGGFSLSHEAVMRYAELVGMTLYADKKYSRYSYYKVPKEEYDKEAKKSLEECGNYKNVNKMGIYFHDRDIERDDPNLIKVVEELGEAANGEFAELKIIEIPDDIQWEVSEYDGMESIHEVHKSWS